MPFQFEGDKVTEIQELYRSLAEAEKRVYPLSGEWFAAVELITTLAFYIDPADYEHINKKVKERIEGLDDTNPRLRITS